MFSHALIQLLVLGLILDLARLVLLPHKFHAVQSALKGAGVEEFTVAELIMLAQSDVTLPEDAQAQFEKMVDALEDLEDVQQVYHNVDLGE